MKALILGVTGQDGAYLAQLLLNKGYTVYGTPDEIYNLAGQSSVGISYELPFETIRSFTLGVLNVMEGMRFLNLKARLFNASSSECFGETGDTPATELLKRQLTGQ